METREAFKEKYENQLKEWGTKVDELKARAEKLKVRAEAVVAKGTANMTTQVGAVHEKYEIAKAKLESLAQATEEQWKDVRAEAEKAWRELEHSVEGARGAFREFKKTAPSKP